MKMAPNPEIPPEVCPMRTGGECVREGNQYHHKCAWFNDGVCDITSISASLDVIARSLELILKKLDHPRLMPEPAEDELDLRPGPITIGGRPWVNRPS